MGYLYVIQKGDTDNYKIGKTETSIKNRLRTLQTGCPEKLSVVSLLNTSLSHLSIKQAENIVHEVFTDKRLIGEWFKLERDDINSIEVGLVSGGVQLHQYYNADIYFNDSTKDYDEWGCYVISMNNTEEKKEKERMVVGCSVKLIRGVEKSKLKMNKTYTIKQFDEYDLELKEMPGNYDKRWFKVVW